MKKTIYFASLPNGYFGSAANSYETLDVKKLSQFFLNNSYSVEYISITDIPEMNFSSNDIIIYTSFFNFEVREYLKDILYYVKDHCLILPTYEMLLAHENKGFQEVMRRALGINDLLSDYVFDIDSITISPPFVLKTIDGSGSSGITLIKDKHDLTKFKTKNIQISKSRKLKNSIRKLKLPTDNYSLYSYYYKPFKRFVTQDFIANLTCDYRVLVTGDRFYAMRRDVKKGDFRASGSKKFHYHDVPNDVLDYAEKIFSKLKNPYISMDLAYKDKTPYLIEFQGTNFGSSVIRHSGGYYTKTIDSWVFVESQPLHEEALSYGLYYYVSNKND